MRLMRRFLKCSMHLNSWMLALETIPCSLVKNGTRLIVQKQVSKSRFRFAKDQTMTTDLSLLKSLPCQIPDRLVSLKGWTCLNGFLGLTA